MFPVFGQKRCLKVKNQKYCVKVHNWLSEQYLKLTVYNIENYETDATKRRTRNIIDCDRYPLLNLQKLERILQTSSIAVNQNPVRTNLKLEFSYTDLM